ncbi:hypothetical protein C1H46_015839 [Malus baccata]|uniref:SET domain-containing protein n=1 Tax=Malus baccata TaxID=106549 RepID=A0A540MII9_MALBA|nr:hypothetical protein C1H46_015839 [Malus baccata]
MEKLKSLVPETLRRSIAASAADDLPRTCSSLADFLLHFEPFQQMVRDLADPEVALCGKNKEAALEAKQKGNKCFLRSDYAEALDCYTQALRVAPMDVDEDRNLVTTLYTNRASVLQKLGLLRECVQDCNRALQTSSNYAKAWYRRGKANASIGNYEDAICDLDVAKVLELSISGKRQIESEMKIISDQHKSTIPSEQDNENNSNILDELRQMELQCVTTPEKGRGMTSTSDLPQASLVHTEDPFAMIILKPCRETHCHYCLNELPADKVPCTSCSIPLYCSQKCRIQAGGKMCWDYPSNQNILENLSANLEKYIVDTTLNVESETDTEHIPEHKHECKGVHWPAVLPSEIVLAGRVLVKSVIKRRGSTDTFHLSEISIVILISQIRVNSMTIVRMKSIDHHGLEDQFGKLTPWGEGLTSNMEQVKVGQAIYISGSLFNHSCQPNIHAYFLSRTLFIRTTEFVTSGVPLEFSYGPQVGQWDCKDRVKFLEDEYSFRCQCRGCLNVNFSNLALNGFHCVKPNCPGIVLDSGVVNIEREKLKYLPRIVSTSSVEPHLQVEEFNTDEINKLAPHVQPNNVFDINPGFCLKCGSYRDLESSSAAADKARTRIRRLRDAIVSQDVSSTVLLDALSSLGLLRSTFFAYNRSIAEAEDNLAQAFCLVGELQPAMEHCKASIEILEKLYNPNHIVIGYELVKLSSLQLSLGDRAAADSINRLYQIFSCYYGSHTYVIFPYLRFLRREKHISSLEDQLT